MRRKAVRLLVGHPYRAGTVMGLMDYDVHLFLDAETGEDAVVYRAGHTGLRLARQRRMHPPATAAARLTVNSHRVPTLSEAEAVDHLVAGWLPWLFYTCRDTGRGRVLYRRYDGDLGLVLPDGGARP